jgi:hypothetical protein
MPYALVQYLIFLAGFVCGLLIALPIFSVRFHFLKAAYSREITRRQDADAAYADTLLKHGIVKACFRKSLYRLRNLRTAHDLLVKERRLGSSR